MKKKNIPSDTNGKRSIIPITVLDQGHLAVGVRARAVEDVVRVAVAVEGVIVVVRVGDTVVVRVGHFVVLCFVRFVMGEKV